MTPTPAAPPWYSYSPRHPRRFGLLIGLVMFVTRWTLALADYLLGHPAGPVPDWGWWVASGVLVLAVYYLALAVRARRRQGTR
jgi:hypothetical protein